MKKFMFLHFGFETPTPEIMEAWGKWFESIADKQVDQGGFGSGRESQKPAPKIYRGAWNPSPATISSKPKTSTRQKISHKPIHTSLASGSMKLGRIKASPFSWHQRLHFAQSRSDRKPEGDLIQLSQPAG